MSTRHFLLRLPGISVVLLVLACGTANGTTIVVVRTANEIVIGADSKVTDTYGNELNDPACKIQQVGNLFIAFEGFLRDKKTGFNVPELARRALQLKANASVAERVSILTGLLTSELFDELLQIRNNSADEFQTKFEGKTFLRIAIAGFEGKKAVVFVRQFRTAFILRKLGVAVVPDDCLSDCKGDVVTRFLGETDAIDGLPEDSSDFWKDGIVTGVRRLVQTEIDARSEYVGPPIDILQIKAEGARWIQKKQGCPDLQTPGERVSQPTRRKRR